MATTVTVGSNYAGKVAGEIIGQAYKEADTIRLGLLTFAQNVNFKYNLRKIQYTDGTVDYSCGDFVPAGAITLSEKVIQPKKVMNNFQVCKEDFRQTWSEDLGGASAHNDQMPADIGEAILMEVLKSQSPKIDDEIWNGLAATDGEIGDGFVPQFTADANVIKANNGITPLGAGGEITEANVESELKKVLAAIPVSLRRKEVVVGVAPNVFQAYNFYLISKGIAWNGTTESKQASFGKYTLTEINGLVDDTFVVYEKSNLVMATGLLGDHNDIRVVDEDEIGLLTGQVRGKLVYNGGMGYYNSEEIIWYLSTTAVV
jgi:hypothetical protein